MSKTKVHEERKDDMATLMEAIEQIMPSAKVTGWSGSYGSTGKMDTSVTFVCQGNVSDKNFLENTFGPIFASGLTRIETNSGMDVAHSFSSSVGWQAITPTTTVTVSVRNVKLAIYELNKKLAWKSYSVEFDELMENTLKKKK